MQTSSNPFRRKLTEDLSQRSSLEAEHPKPSGDGMASFEINGTKGANDLDLYSDDMVVLTYLLRVRGINIFFVLSHWRLASR